MRVAFSKSKFNKILIFLKNNNHDGMVVCIVEKKFKIDKLNDSNLKK